MPIISALGGLRQEDQEFPGQSGIHNEILSPKEKLRNFHV
jgi:hypothetical protein